MIVDRQSLLEDEWLIVRHSGEIPEIALASVLYYLMEDEQGPCLILNEDEANYLKSGAEQRYLEIVFRDIQPENRDKTIYRGVKRTIYNYHRFGMFCQRRGVEPGNIQSQVAVDLLAFLKREVDDVVSGYRSCCLNAEYAEIVDFCAELGVKEEQLPDGLREICP